jgi:hypothetical protein
MARHHNKIFKKIIPVKILQSLIIRSLVLDPHRPKMLDPDPLRPEMLGPDPHLNQCVSTILDKIVPRF